MGAIVKSKDTQFDSIQSLLDSSIVLGGTFLI